MELFYRAQKNQAEFDDFLKVVGYPPQLIKDGIDAGL